jgi:hypothetical protein
VCVCVCLRWECVGIDQTVTKAAAVQCGGDTSSTFISGQDFYGVEEWVDPAFASWLRGF